MEQGGPLQEHQTRGLGVDDGAGSAEARSCGQEESDSVLVPVTFSILMRCATSELAGESGITAVLEAALRKELGREFKLGRMRVGPSDDTLQRVLPLLLDRVEPESAAHFNNVCKAWQQGLEALGFCRKTAHLCSTLAGDELAHYLSPNVLRRLDASTGDDPERAMCLDANAFLQRSMMRRGSLLEWLQAASQEPDASFLSRGAASTAHILGLQLVQWAGKPQGRDPESYTVSGHSKCVISAAFAPDAKRAFSFSTDNSVKIWDVATGAEVSSFVGVQPVW